MEPLVSCVMITRGMREHLELSVRSYERQTHGNKELIVLHRGLDFDTFEWLETVRGVRLLFVKGDLSLGARRNMAIEHADGDFVATWDDDDYSAPDRISAQLLALQKKEADAVLLKNLVLWDEPRKSFFQSGNRVGGWEQTMLARRTLFQKHRYPPLDVGEDTALLQRMKVTRKVIVEDIPQRYVYRWHGSNVSAADHFRRMFFLAKQLPEQEQKLWKERMRCGWYFPSGYSQSAVDAM